MSIPNYTPINANFNDVVSLFNNATQTISKVGDVFSKIREERAKERTEQEKIDLERKRIDDLAQHYQDELDYNYFKAESDAEQNALLRASQEKIAAGNNATTIRSAQLNNEGAMARTKTAEQGAMERAKLQAETSRYIANAPIEERKEQARVDSLLEQRIGDSQPQLLKFKELNTEESNLKTTLEQSTTLPPEQYKKLKADTEKRLAEIATEKKALGQQSASLMANILYHRKEIAKETGRTPNLGPFLGQIVQNQIKVDDAARQVTLKDKETIKDALNLGINSDVFKPVRDAIANSGNTVWRSETTQSDDIATAGDIIRMYLPIALSKKISFPEAVSHISEAIINARKNWGWIGSNYIWKNVYSMLDQTFGVTPQQRLNYLRNTLNK